MTRRSLLASSAVAFALVACAAHPTQSAPPAQAAPASPPAPAAAPAPVAPTPSAPPPAAHIADFAQARPQFAKDTAARFGIPVADIEAVLAKAARRDSIIAAMSRPAEAKPWRDYRPIFIQQKRIDEGRAFLAANREALARAEARHGVPAEIVTAIIGVETSFGRVQGTYPVIDALYTLAFWYPRTGDPAKAGRETTREAFFRDELAQLFALGREEGFDLATLKGSYAGAMGWGQFMPSSYRGYAVDGDGDGKRDLFGNREDVIASVANYFAQKGEWRRGGPVMQRASRDAGAADFNADKIEMTETVASLAARGYRAVGAAPRGDTPANLIVLEGVAGPEYWIVYDNFRAITRYNSSRLYATAVYQLAESIAGRES